VGRWLWSTIDMNKIIQIVGLIETLEKNSKTTNGWVIGANFNLTQQTVVRANYFLSAKDKNMTGCGVLFQQSF